jgi:hypothetical protein
MSSVVEIEDERELDAQIDAQILAGRCAGLSPRALARRFGCSVAEIQRSLDRSLPTIEAAVVLLRILERRSGLLGLDQPARLDLQVIAEHKPADPTARIRQVIAGLKALPASAETEPPAAQPDAPPDNSGAV